MKNPSKNWSAEVTKHSIALDLEKGVAKESPRRKAKTPYQSAMSMLNFYINRAGKKLSPERKAILEKAKKELRRIFGR